MKNYDFGLNPKLGIVTASRPFRIYIAYPDFKIDFGDKINRIQLLLNYDL